MLLTVSLREHGIRTLFTSARLSKWLLSGLLLSFGTTPVHGEWKQTRYDEMAGRGHHVSVTGTAEGWLGSYGHPKLRVSCESTINGSDLHIGFHFPAEHVFLPHSSRNEPVSLTVTGPEQELKVQETIQYFSVSASGHSVFRTLLASDGVISTRQSGKLLLDLQHGDTLEVRFMQQPHPYRLQYNLEGFTDLVAEVLQHCQLLGFSYSDLGTSWADYIKVTEVAGILTVQRPVYGAAQPAIKLPEM